MEKVKIIAVITAGGLNLTIDGVNTEVIRQKHGYAEYNNLLRPIRAEINKVVKAVLKENDKAELEARDVLFDEKAWERAAQKRARWQRAAYGCTDWYGNVCESGIGIVMTYYSESLTKNEPGQQTLNREAFGAYAERYAIVGKVVNYYQTGRDK